MSTPASLTLGSSIPVPSVKELVSQSLDTVPHRYLRNIDADYPTAAPFSDSSSLDVPILDLTKLVDPQYQHLELQKLHDACKHWGIFQVNHISFYQFLLFLFFMWWWLKHICNSYKLLRLRLVHTHRIIWNSMEIGISISFQKVFPSKLNWIRTHQIL